MSDRSRLGGKKTVKNKWAEEDQRRQKKRININFGGRRRNGLNYNFNLTV
jgi:hypothetical protein